MIAIYPASVGEVAQALTQASRSGQRVAVRGGGTKREWGFPGSAVDIELHTDRLNAVLAHRHADLTATVQAGAALSHVNRVLARHQQWIPLDPPEPDRATIGGIVATNDSGPRRHRYGAPRDLIIGIEVVLADGTCAKAGGIVVKNVAGYDLSRLMTGSFGSLAVIVSATFKLFPVPPASRTVVIDLETEASRQGSLESDASNGGTVLTERLGNMLSALLSSQLTPSAIEVRAPAGQLLVRFETVDVAADQQAATVVALAERVGARAAIVRSDEETVIWDAHMRQPWAGEGVVFKLTMLPTDVAPTLAWLAEAVGDADYEVVGRAGVGVLLVRIGDDVLTQIQVLNGLRDRLPPGRGSVVVVRGSRQLRAAVDPWGPMGDALPLMRSVKQQFDPKGILNPARAPGGL